MSGIGHNGGPRDPLTPAIKIERILSLLEIEGLTSAQKCVGVKIIAEANRDGVASVRTQELQRAASARDRETVFRATKALGEVGIEKSSGLGQAGRYSVLPERVVASVIEAYEQNRTGRLDPDQSELERSGQTGRDGAPNPVGFNHTRSDKQVGLNSTGPNEPVGMIPTGRLDPDQSQPRVSARIESPSGILTFETEDNNYPKKLGKGGVGEKPTDTKSKRGRKPYLEDFEQFWAAYPDTTNNSKARAADEWAKITAEDRIAAISSLGAFAEFTRSNPDYRCLHAERYLKYRRFDGFAEIKPKPTVQYWWQNPEKLAQVDDDGWDRLIDKHANGSWPVDKLGWWPGHEKCVVPDRVIKRRRLIEMYDSNGIARGGFNHA